MSEPRENHSASPDMDILKKELVEKNTLLLRQSKGLHLLNDTIEALNRRLVTQTERAANYENAYHVNERRLFELQKKYSDGNLPSFIVPESMKLLVNSVTEDNARLCNIIKTKSGAFDVPELIRELESVKKANRNLSSREKILQNNLASYMEYFQQNATDDNNTANQKWVEKDKQRIQNEVELQELIDERKQFGIQRELFYEAMCKLKKSEPLEPTEQKWRIKMETMKTTYLQQISSLEKKLQEKQLCDGSCDFVKCEKKDFQEYRDLVKAFSVSMAENYEGEGKRVLRQMQHAGLIDKDLPTNPPVEIPRIPLPVEPYLMANPPQRFHQRGLVADGCGSEVSPDGSHGEEQDVRSSDTPHGDINYYHCPICNDFVRDDDRDTHIHRASRTP